MGNLWFIYMSPLKIYFYIVAPQRKFISSATFVLAYFLLTEMDLVRPKNQLEQSPD